MTAETVKVETPPYPSYSTFLNFIKGLRETGVPSRIDKSIMGKMSGSGQSALMATLKWLKLIDAAGFPQPSLDTLVHADDAQYSAALKVVLEASYGFLTDGSITLTKATTAQVEQKFREYGITGSTVIKCMAFFLMAIKDAGIAVGPHVKTPKVVPTNGAKRRPKKGPAAPATEGDDGDDDEGDGIPDEMSGFVKIPIPLHGMDDGAVFLPDNMTKSQWAYALKITKFLIENYRPDDAPDGAEDLA